MATMLEVADSRTIHRHVLGTATLKTAAAVRIPLEAAVATVLVAIALRACAFDAFIVPSGSMYPTLLGRHRNVLCQHCGHTYAVDAAGELDVLTGRSRPGEQLAAAQCSDCGRTTHLNRGAEPSVVDGDRVWVDRLARSPARWDVIVFHDPEHPDRFCVKRIIGLPGEVLRMRHGEIWFRAPDKSTYHLARKPASVFLSMLQPVTHLKCVSAESIPENAPKADSWRWMRYGRVMPSSTPEGIGTPRLVADTVSYNSGTTRSSPAAQDAQGLHWVRDLVLVCDFTLVDRERARDRGAAIVCELVSAGRASRLQWDCATGALQLMLEGCAEFHPRAQRTLDPTSPHRVVLANVDSQHHVWIDGHPIAFDVATTFDSPGESLPTLEDLRPAAVGSRGIGLRIDEFRLFRDVYFTTCSADAATTGDYIRLPAEVYTSGRSFLERPDVWRAALMADNVKSQHFHLSEDRYLCLGDNSPRSYDSRRWSHASGVPKELIVGRVLGDSQVGLVP